MRDETDRPLTPEEKRALLDVARNAVESAVKGQSLPEFHYDFSIFKENRGAFVTLHRHGELRGCIGYVFAVKPLMDTVVDMAQAAALRDPRFTPVSVEELSELDIEISVLSLLRKATLINEIQIGVHGIYIKKGVHTGLLLPQVAVEYGWDRSRFLEQTCYKAGLPGTAWQDEDTEIEIFSAEVFSDSDV